MIEITKNWFKHSFIMLLKLHQSHKLVIALILFFNYMMLFNINYRHLNCLLVLRNYITFCDIYSSFIVLYNSSDKSSPHLKVIAESNTRSMQRMNPLPGEGTSLSPTKEGTQIHPAHKDIPPSMTESLKSEEGFPDEFSIAASSNNLPQYYT